MGALLVGPCFFLRYAMFALLPAVVRGEYHVRVLHRGRAAKLAHYSIHQVVQGLQGLDAPVVSLVYFRDLISTKSRPPLDPRRFVRNVPLVEGVRPWYALLAVEVVSITRCRDSRFMGGDRRNIGEEWSAARETRIDELSGPAPKYVGLVVTLTSAEVPYCAIVVHIVVVVLEGECCQPDVPA